jgi:hypothetical protein
MVAEDAHATRLARVRTINVSYCVHDETMRAESVDTGGALVDFSRDSKLVPQSESELTVVIVWLETCSVVDFSSEVR